jgi:hypothetical protein
MSQETMNLNISLDKTTPIVCEECNNDTFTQVLYIRKASKFLTGTSQDAVMPIPSFACAKCNHVNKEFKPSVDQQEA